MRIKNSGGDYRNYLERTGKLYDQNAFGILPENKDNMGINLYKINTVNGISSDGEGANCKMGYRTPDSLTSVTFQKRAIHTATRKWANPGYNSRTSVNSRNRTQQLKYNTILGGQINNKGGVNNCVNGQDCSLYVSPQYGSNNGVKSNIYIPISIPRSKCNGRRLAGMRQTCAPSCSLQECAQGGGGPCSWPCSWQPNFLNWSITNSFSVNISSPINFSASAWPNLPIQNPQYKLVSSGWISFYNYPV